MGVSVHLLGPASFSIVRSTEERGLTERRSPFDQLVERRSVKPWAAVVLPIARAPLLYGRRRKAVVLSVARARPTLGPKPAIQPLRWAG